MAKSGRKVRLSGGPYKPDINRKRQQPRQHIRRLLRSFEPLQPPGEPPGSSPKLKDT